MAQKAPTRYIDDLDGSAADGAVRNPWNPGFPEPDGGVRGRGSRLC